MQASRFAHPMKFTGDYSGYWAGFRFLDALGYTDGNHPGDDYNWGAGNDDVGMPALSIANGQVALVGNYTNRGFGNTVIIKHTLTKTLADKYGQLHVYSRQLHLQNIRVKKGQTVKVGQQIAEVGNTGTTWGHDHIEIWKGSLGVHLEYHKDVSFIRANYYPPYSFIEANKSNKEGEKEPMLKRQDIVTLFYRVRGYKPTEKQIETWSGKEWPKLYYSLIKSTKATAHQNYGLKGGSAAVKRDTTKVVALLNEVIKEIKK